MIEKVFSKTFKDKSSMAENLEKAIKIYEISKENFIFPQVIRSNNGNRSIDFFFIEEILCVKDVYISFMKGEIEEKKASEIFSKIGRCLGLIHKKLRLSTKTTFEKCKFFGGKTRGFSLKNSENVFLHGDFGFSNIFLDQRSGDICIIDPYPNGYTSFNVNTFGPFEMDVSFFLMCLEGIVPLKETIYLDQKKISLLQEYFLDGYFVTTSYKRIDNQLVLLRDFLFDCYFKHRYNYQFVSSFARSILNFYKVLNKFKKIYK